MIFTVMVIMVGAFVFGNAVSTVTNVPLYYIQELIIQSELVFENVYSKMAN